MSNRRIIWNANALQLAYIGLGARQLAGRPRNSHQWRKQGGGREQVPPDAAGDGVNSLVKIFYDKGPQK